jgi:hypothetical protein
MWMKNRFLTFGLCLSTIVVLLEAILFLENRSMHFASQSEAAFRVVGAVCLLFGLWVQSSFVRVSGGIYLALTEPDDDASIAPDMKKAFMAKRSRSNVWSLELRSKSNATFFHMVVLVRSVAAIASDC